MNGNHIGTLTADFDAMAWQWVDRLRRAVALHDRIMVHHRWWRGTCIAPDGEVYNCCVVCTCDTRATLDLVAEWQAKEPR